MEQLAPPDIEKALVAYLAPLLAPVRVGTRVPNPRPSSLVRISGTGGTRRNLAMATLNVLVEAWSEKQGDASNLAALAWAHVSAAEGGWLDSEVWVSRVRPSAPANFPDPDTTSPRYQFLASLVVPLTRLT